MNSLTLTSSMLTATLERMVSQAQARSLPASEACIPPYLALYL